MNTTVLAQSTSPGYGGAFLAISLLIYAAIIVLGVAGQWKIFTKAGKPGWAAIVPIYNTIVLLEVIGRPVWWIALLLLGAVIPIIGWIGFIVLYVIIMVDLATSFGKGGGFAVGLILLPLVFFPILGFGEARYLGPRAQGYPPPPAYPPPPGYPQAPVYPPPAPPPPPSGPPQ